MQTRKNSRIILASIAFSISLTNIFYSTTIISGLKDTKERIFGVLLIDNGKNHNYFYADATNSSRLLLQIAQTPRPIPDDVINITMEQQRCRRHGLQYGNRTTRRRIFWGSLLADDSWHAIGSVALETYGIFDLAVFVESNLTQSLYHRDIRFFPGSEAWDVVTKSGIFGPTTKVIVDYYYSKDPNLRDLGREHGQRALIIDRWKKEGMTKDDIGYVSDADETFNRDFLRAMQVCLVPEFEFHNHCELPLVRADSWTFEGSLRCLTSLMKNTPSLVIGECIDKIGDSTKHPKPERGWNGIGWMSDGWTKKGKFASLPKPTNNETGNINGAGTTTLYYPLLNAADFRRLRGHTYRKSGYHFHNFFPSIVALRFKYKTYGHPVRNAQDERMPVENIHSDIEAMVSCLMDRPFSNPKFRVLKDGMDSPNRLEPVVYQYRDYVDARHREIYDEVLLDEAKRNKTRQLDMKVKKPIMIMNDSMWDPNIFEMLLRDGVSGKEAWRLSFLK